VYHMLVVYAEPFNLYIKKKDTFVRNEKWLFQIIFIVDDEKKKWQTGEIH
jgi:hypothetical protein